MLHLSSLWGVATLLALGLTASRIEANIIGCGSDGRLCELFKYVKCSSSVIDAGFLLDKSGSMIYGSNVDGTSGESCPVKITNSETGCRRQDVMRIVMRLVMKRLFNKFSKGCYEYIESEGFKQSRQSCEEIGFTTPRVTVIWWSSSPDVDISRTQQWTKGDTSKWSNDIDDFLFGADGTRREARWERINGNYIIKDEAVDEYFDTILFKDDYPESYGLTIPYYGLKKWNDVVKNLWSNTLTDKQKESSVFTTFLMTDGEVTTSVVGNRYYNKGYRYGRNYYADELRNTGKTYGLGLTGSAKLIAKQKFFFDSIGFVYETKVANGDVLSHFFSTEETANKIIEVIFDRIVSGCQTCYRLAGYDDQCTFGTDIPVFPGFNDPDRRPPETETVENSGEDLKIEQNEVVTDELIKFSGDDEVFMIKRGTILCTSYLASYPDIKFVDYTPDTDECKCCKSLKFKKGSGKCMCDYSNAPSSETETLVGDKKPMLRSVKQYSANSRLASEVYANVTAFSLSEANDDGLDDDIVLVEQSDNNTRVIISFDSDNDIDTGGISDNDVIEDGSKTDSGKDLPPTDKGNAAAVSPSLCFALLAAAHAGGLR